MLSDLRIASLAQWLGPVPMALVQCCGKPDLTGGLQLPRKVFLCREIERDSVPITAVLGVIEREIRVDGMDGWIDWWVYLGIDSQINVCR